VQLLTAALGWVFREPAPVRGHTENLAGSLGG
jgi:hypothetical protein